MHVLFLPPSLAPFLRGLAVNPISYWCQQWSGRVTPGPFFLRSHRDSYMAPLPTLNSKFLLPLNATADSCLCAVSIAAEQAAGHFWPGLSLIAQSRYIRLWTYGLDLEAAKNMETAI